MNIIICCKQLRKITSSRLFRQAPNSVLLNPENDCQSECTSCRLSAELWSQSVSDIQCASMAFENLDVSGQRKVMKSLLEDVGIRYKRRETYVYLEL